MKNIFLFLALSIISSCSSSPAKLFQSIQLGDEKGPVLAKLGNPVRTYYKEDTHRWVYLLDNSAGTPVEKEIWFQNGRVVYFDALKTKKTQEVKKPIQFEPVE